MIFPDSDKENTSDLQPNVTDIRTHELLVEKLCKNPKHFDESINKIVKNQSLINNYKSKTTNNSFNTSYKHRNRWVTNNNFQSPVLQKSPFCSTPFKEKYRGKSIYNFSPISTKERVSLNDVAILEENNGIDKSSGQVAIQSKEQTSPRNHIPDKENKTTSKSIIYEGEIDPVPDLCETELLVENDPEPITSRQKSVTEHSLFQLTEAEPFLGFSHDNVTESITNNKNNLFKCIQKNNSESNSNQSINKSDRDVYFKRLSAYVNLNEYDNGKSYRDTCLENQSEDVDINEIEINCNDQSLENPESSIICHATSTCHLQNTSSDSHDSDKESMYDTCNSEQSFSEENKNNRVPKVTVERMSDSVFINFYKKMLIDQEDSSSRDSSLYDEVQSKIDFNQNDGDESQDENEAQSENDDNQSDVHKSQGENQSINYENQSKVDESQIDVDEIPNEENNEELVNKSTDEDARCHKDASFHNFLHDNITNNFYAEETHPIIDLNQNDVDKSQSQDENEGQSDIDENQSDFDKSQSQGENQSNDYDNQSRVDEILNEENNEELDYKSNVSFYNFLQDNISNTYSEETHPNEITISDSSTEGIESYYETTTLEDEQCVSFVTTRRRNEITNDSMFIFDNSYCRSSTDCDKIVLSNKTRLSYLVEKSDLGVDISIHQPRTSDINEIDACDENIQDENRTDRRSRTTTRKCSRLPRQSNNNTNMDSSMFEATIIGTNENGDRASSEVLSSKQTENASEHTRSSVQTKKSSRVLSDSIMSDRPSKVKPSIALQPGKKWERSMSIYRRMTTIADHFDQSLLEGEGLKKGRKYRQSIINTMGMQGIIYFFVVFIIILYPFW